jgi:hypothetical protein
VLGNIVYIFSQEIPKVMYVNSREGINLMNEPSFEGKKIMNLLHGERIFVYERYNSITIDGVTNIWYKARKLGTSLSGWVFEEYLSEEIPLNVNPILGYWDTDKGEWLCWNFMPDNEFFYVRKESDAGYYGNWNISENELILTLIPLEWMDYEEDIIIIKIEILDNNNILLYNNPLFYYNGTIEKLTRNNNIN